MLVAISEDSELRHDWYNYLKLFRVGEWALATDAVKESWYIFVSLIVPGVTTKWNPEKCLMAGVKYSDVVTSSNELFAHHVVERNAKRWLERIGKKESGEKKEKMSKKHWTITEKTDFFTDHLTLDQTWKDPVWGQGWDDGFVEFYKSRHDFPGDAISTLDTIDKEDDNGHDEEEDSEAQQKLLSVPVIYPV